MSKRWFFKSSMLAFIIINQAVAGSMGAVKPDPSAWSWVSALSIGPVWERSGQTQTFFLSPDIEKTYTAEKSTTALPAGELFLGIQKNLRHQFQGQLGAALVVTGNAKLDGEIWDDADPLFNNYTYTYQVNHTHIALKGRLLLDRGYWVIPWVSGSVGVGFNRAHGFMNTPTIFEALPNNNFANNTKTSFTYTLGAGVQKELREHWQLGIGYQFADWGQSQLGRASEQTMNSGLALNHLYTNGFLINVTYIS